MTVKPSPRTGDIVTDPFIAATNAVADLARERDEAVHRLQIHLADEASAQAINEGLRDRGRLVREALHGAWPGGGLGQFIDVLVRRLVDERDEARAQAVWAQRFREQADAQEATGDIAPDCGHPNHPSGDHNCTPFLPTPDTSRVTFGTRHPDTGMVLLQHDDTPGITWGSLAREVPDWHRAQTFHGAAHAALAEVREALTTAEADEGVDVFDEDVICGMFAGLDDIPTEAPSHRARRYLAREVQALVDEGLRGEFLNAQVPYRVTDHRAPVEADTSSDGMVSWPGDTCRNGGYVGPCPGHLMQSEAGLVCDRCGSRDQDIPVEAADTSSDDERRWHDTVDALLAAACDEEMQNDGASMALERLCKLREDVRATRTSEEQS